MVFYKKCKRDKINDQIIMIKLLEFITCKEIKNRLKTHMRYILNKLFVRNNNDFKQC